MLHVTASYAMSAAVRKICVPQAYLGITIPPTIWRIWQFIRAKFRGTPYRDAHAQDHGEYAQGQEHDARLPTVGLEASRPNLDLPFSTLTL